MTSSKTIAIQGIKGAFHDEAGQKLIPDSTSIECSTFQEVFEAVKSGKSDYGIVAIENSLHGSINAVYRLLERNNIWIAGEITLKIDQYLIGTTTVPLEQLNTPEAEVRTMFPAFAQCELWLDKNLPKAQRIEMFDTAASVEYIVKNPSPQRVSIGGKHAAEIYGGTIIAGPINDDPNNYTRFVLLTKDHAPVSGANRTSIILHTGHSHGALYRALGAFEHNGINLSKLDSHPVADDTRHYAFYIDFEAGIDTADAARAIKELETQGCTVRVLGSYRAVI